jgi:hypothetical protein
LSLLASSNRVCGATVGGDLRVFDLALRRRANDAADRECPSSGGTVREDLPS